MSSEEKSHIFNFGIPARPSETKMSQSNHAREVQAKKELVNVEETLTHNLRRKRQWRKPRTLAEGDRKTQLGGQLNYSPEGKFRLHPWDSPEVRGQFKSSDNETSGPSRLPQVTRYARTGSTDFETLVCTKTEESIRQTLEGRGYPKGIFRLTPIVRGQFIPKVTDQPHFDSHEQSDDATPGPSRISEQFSMEGSDDIDEFDYELDLTKEMSTPVIPCAVRDLMTPVVSPSKKRKREEDEEDEDLKPSRKRARRTGSWLPSKKRKREDEEDDEELKPPPKRARHTGSWTM